MGGVGTGGGRSFPIVIFPVVERPAISTGAAGSGAEAMKSALAVVRSVLSVVTITMVLVWPPGAVAICIVIGSWAVWL